jgi:hypothetical protein
MEMGWHPGPGGLGHGQGWSVGHGDFTRAPATISPRAFPDLVEACPDRRDAGRRTSGADRWRVQTGSFNTICNSGSTARPFRKNCWRHPAFFGPMTCCRMAKRIFAPLPVCERRARLETFVFRMNPERFDCSPCWLSTAGMNSAALRADPIRHGSRCRSKG